MQQRLAIIGCGSSGLISLKYARDELPDWDIVCYEQTDRLTGCWGNPYPGFVSTSTKYTTQFSCFPQYDATMNADGGASREEFFRDGEYGAYLERFADEFDLRKNVRFRHRVADLERSNDGWRLSVIGLDRPDRNQAATSEQFDAVILCTGLAAVPKSVDCRAKQLSVEELQGPKGLGHITDKTIVVLGGGESAVDYARRLAASELKNDVYLSLQTGIRVSPRYHPIRGVPSDYLRNRLMLSIHEDIRNWIGQRFVELRIRYEDSFRKWFPSRHHTESQQRIAEARKDWAFRLTKAAKDDLFNMFHNKSDDFLDAVAEGRLKIIGPATDASMQRFWSFPPPDIAVRDPSDSVVVEPDAVVPAIGYRSELGEWSAKVRVPDFYLGCVHAHEPNLYLVGFARPIIGNIPTISEMQARFVTGILSGKFTRPNDIKQRHERDSRDRASRYQKLNLDVVYPVEMFPYCDRLAHSMQCDVNAKNLGSVLKWWRAWTSPATTMHYWFDDQRAKRYYENAATYLPPLLVFLLVALKPVDWLYRLLRGRAGMLD